MGSDILSSGVSRSTATKAAVREGYETLQQVNREPGVQARDRGDSRMKQTSPELRSGCNANIP